MESRGYHIPVMLKEAIDYLNIEPDGNYIDCTLGEAGHSIEILERLNSGKLTSYERDYEAIEFVQNKYSDLVERANWEIIRDNFANICKYHAEESIDGILLDIGLSSRQLEKVNRGFSYMDPTQKLDMRMDDRLGVKASDLINALNEAQLTRLFRQFGEERFSKKIASAIKRKDQKFESVKDLTDVIDGEVPVTHSRYKTYGRIFQALRIVVNDELDSLREALICSTKLLKPGGRLVVITFHSLEDRVVKEHFKAQNKIGAAVIEVRALKPSPGEIERNKRSHSAKLSVLTKV